MIVPHSVSLWCSLFVLCYESSAPPFHSLKAQTHSQPGCGMFCSAQAEMMRGFTAFYISLADFFSTHSLTNYILIILFTLNSSSHCLSLTEYHV